MFKDLDYKKIYIETYGLSRSQIAKVIYEKQKRIMELEDINEEHRKLNTELNRKIKELEESNENNNV